MNESHWLTRKQELQGLAVQIIQHHHSEGRGAYTLVAKIPALFSVFGEGGVIPTVLKNIWMCKGTAYFLKGNAVWSHSLYVIAGDGSHGPSNAVDRYDGGTHWTNCESLPVTERRNPGVFALGSYEK
jgi:hypothetical protein